MIEACIFREAFHHCSSQLEGIDCAGKTLESNLGDAPEAILGVLLKDEIMTTISELVDDARFIFRYRTKTMKVQRALDRKAPKAGDLAPDFTLYDVIGTNAVMLSDYRGKKPVALIFGSYT